MDQPIVIAPSRNSRRILLLGGVCSIATASLIWVLHDMDWGQFRENLAFIDWRWVIPAVVFDVLSYVCQAARWNYVLGPLDPPSLLRSTQAIYVGLFTSEVLPLRAGEVVRAYLVSLWTRIGFSVTVSSVAIERLLDGLWLAIAFGIAAFLVPLPGYLLNAAKILGVVVLVSAAVLVLILVEGVRVTEALQRSRATRRGPFAWLVHFADHLAHGLHRIGHSASLYWAIATSLLLLILQISAVWAMMWSYGLQYSFWVASVVLIILHLGTAIPNAPGNIGSYQFFCVVALTLFGVDKTTAAGFSLVAFAVLTVPLLLIGFVSLLLTGFSLHEIRHDVRKRLNGNKACLL